MSLRKILLLQLPIPQPGQSPAEGNIPLAAGYLKLFARRHGLESAYAIDIFPPSLANTLSDAGLVAAILALSPEVVGFTCYLWNIDRNVDIAQRLKAVRPDLRILLGGPEITADNSWVLDHPAVDFAVIGEGEQTFVELLQARLQDDIPRAAIPGLWISPRWTEGVRQLPAFRQPLSPLDAVSSPYLEGILDAAEEGVLLLETVRGCIFKCKFCYYPKSYDDLYFVSREKIVANLEYARQQGVREVVLLDPTLNQRKDFAGFVRLLADCNPDRSFTYFGELRAEGITPEIAGLLREANFTEVEIGLQSIDPNTQLLMDRRNNLKAFERGVQALRAAGIRVKIDLIIGLPGDTPASIRRGLHYLRDSHLADAVQVFNLAILPGTAFRQEAEQLGLRFQPRPPYYVLETPALKLPDFYDLMAEAQEVFDTEFDPLPPPELPELPCSAAAELAHCHYLDFDLPAPLPTALPPAERRTQAFTVWFAGKHLLRERATMTRLISELLADNPHTTLQIVLEPKEDPAAITVEFLEAVRAAGYRQPSYLDRYYSISPGGMKGAKRLVILLPMAVRSELDAGWIDAASEYASFVWRGREPASTEWRPCEFLVQ